MAALNTEVTQSNNTTGKTGRTVSHYMNISAVKKDGTTVSLGAVHIYNGGDKNQRTLIDAVLNKGIDPEHFDIVFNIKDGTKSEEIGSIDDWASRTDKDIGELAKG